MFPGGQRETGRIVRSGRRNDGVMVADFRSVADRPGVEAFRNIHAANHGSDALCNRGFSLITSFNFFSFHADIEKGQPISRLPLRNSNFINLIL
jgi:hypothetical protein